MIRILLMTMTMIAIGCGDGPDKKFTKIPDPTNNPPNNKSNNNNNTSTNNNNSVTNNVTNNIVSPNNIPDLCGNGQLDPGEVCDPLAIGADRCPTECPSNLECSTITLVGSAENCTARCEVRPVGCIDDDGCCSLGCDSTTDNDCMNVCGNGIVEENETCDGNCPTTCNDNNACTSDMLTGSPQTCDVECVSVPINSCRNGDGCCPAGCTSQNDNDCVCNPTTSCQTLGYSCGTLNNGCQTVSCGMCSGNQTCQNNTCVNTVVNRVGDACTTTAQCGAGLECATQANEGFAGGYCTKICLSDSECGSGAHCSSVGGNGGMCVKSCASNNECSRTGYECYQGIGDGRLECWHVANGNGAIGTPCTYNGQCSGGQAGFCIRQANTPDFYQGYCSASCVTNSDCGNTNSYHCWRSNAGNAEGVCVAKTCNRAGYLVFNSNPTIDSLNECWPAGTGSRGVGVACEGVWQCGGGTDGICLRPPTANLANGYCSLICESSGFCPGGSTCWQDAVCVDNCTFDFDCRSSEGYVCANADGIDFCWM